MTQLTNRADSITLVKMFKHIQIPASFSLIEKGKALLLLKDEYKNLLLAQRIDDLKTFLEKNRHAAYYLKGRIPHPSIPFENGKRLVLRQYSHGGLLRAVTGSLYTIGARSFRELALTEEIRSCGIPTIPSIGAIHLRLFFPFYRAYFLSLEVPHAMDLIRYFSGIKPHPSREEISSKRRTIRSTGLLIRQFHRAGFFHGDLQLKNILVTGDQILLIAPLARCEHDLLGRQRAVIGDEEEVAIFLEEPQLSLVGRQSLAEYDDPVIPLTGHWPVPELGDHLLLCVDRLETPLPDDPGLVPLRPLAGYSLDRSLGPLEVAISGLRQLLSQRDEFGVGIDAEDEANVPGAVPAVEVLGLGKVCITSEEERAETGVPAEGSRLIDKARGHLV